MNALVETKDFDIRAASFLFEVDHAWVDVMPGTPQLDMACCRVGGDTDSIGGLGILSDGSIDFGSTWRCFRDTLHESTGAQQECRRSCRLEALWVEETDRSNSVVSLPHRLQMHR